MTKDHASEESDSTPSMINDHPFSPPEGEPWELCTVCSLAQSAHTDTLVDYASIARQNKYRCPLCVKADAPECNHTRQEIDEYIYSTTDLKPGDEPQVYSKRKTD